MAATLDIVNNFELVAQGITLDGKQGAITGAMTDPYRISGASNITVNGNPLRIANSLANNTAALLWDASTSPITSFVFAHFWNDVDMDLQLITSATNAILTIAAFAGFDIPGFGKLLAAANTTPITGTAPTLTAITKIYAGNYSGGTGNYILTLVN